MTKAASSLADRAQAPPRGGEGSVDVRLNVGGCYRAIHVVMDAILEASYMPGRPFIKLEVQPVVNQTTVTQLSRKSTHGRR